MPQQITIGYRELMAEAESKIGHVEAAQAIELAKDKNVVVVDIRDIRELEREGRIPGSFHAPRGMLEFWVDPASPYHKPVFAEDKTFIIHCASGWRSVLATQTLQRMGLKPVLNLQGGFAAWKEAGGPVERLEKEMSGLRLVIGNKNYSSWSLRAWIAMTMAGIPFEEILVPLDQPGTAARIARHSKAGRVPVLHDGDLTIWESLAILEYLAERFPEKQLWPKTRAARAMARSMASEMHAGFSGLRSACPMNLRRPRRFMPLSDHVRADVKRIEQMWREARAKHGKGGKFLFGKFSNADAMFAPVVTRFDTYAIEVADDTRAYMNALFETPAFKAWKEAALKEKWTVPSDEVD